MPVTKPNPAEILRRVRELHSSGVAAACSSRQRDGVRLMRRGMALLDLLAPPEPGYRDEWLLVRIRLACTLAYLVADTSSSAEGLAGLDEVRTLIRSVTDPGTRAELTLAADHNTALLLMFAGRNEESITYFDAALDFHRSRLAKATDPAPLIGAYLNTLPSRGMAFTRLGAVGKARADLTTAIDLAERYALLSTAADIHRPLGTLELRTGNVPAALWHYGECDRIYKTLGVDAPSLLRRDQADALLTAGLGDEAAKHLDNVLPVMREQRSATRDLADVELFRAAAALMNDELDLARRLAATARRRMLRWGCQTCVATAAIIGLRADTRDALRSGAVPASLPARAVRVAKKMPAPQAAHAALARMLAARLEIRRGNLTRAADLLQQVPRPGQVTTTDYRMLRRLCRAELAAAEGNRGKALTEIRSALTELDRVRDRMGGLELVSGTALHGEELGELALRLTLLDGVPRRVFDWLERTRAQSYRYEPVGDGDDPYLADVVAEVRSLGQAIHHAQHEGHPVAGLRARYAERLGEAHRLGWHTGRWGRPRPVAGLTEVIAQLGERALVSYAASGGSLVAVVVAGGEARLVRLGSAAVAADGARTLHQDLNVLAPDQLPQPLVSVVLQSARKQADLLDEQLIQPLADLIGDRELVVVPTGDLYAVPWGVLPSLWSRPTVVTPSATAWLAAERVRAPRARKVVLVRGPGLPGAKGEIDKLATHYRTAKLLEGSRAKVSAVLRALDGAKLVHIAAHGSHERENALFSRLELTDGAMFAHEMAALKQPPYQVVFAVCELALNRIRAGDEALGFASALLAGGSRTVIAPLSRVGDQASAAVMDDYHGALAAGASPASALADAIAVDPFRRPFVCLGAG